MRSIPPIFGLEALAPHHFHSEPIRVLLSEPDAASRRLICSLLDSQSSMKVVCVEDSKLLSSIHEIDPDVVILDVHAPAIRRAPNWGALGIRSAPVTIVTAYDPSAVSAFAFTAIDFIVKPFSVERFEAALDLATSSIIRARVQFANKQQPSALDRVVPQRQFLQRLAVEVGEKIMLVRVSDIAWVQSSGNNVRLHLGEALHLIRQSMKNLQSLLDPNRFLRVHRNAIVNLDHVEEFHLPPQGNMFVKLNNGVCIPLRKGNRAHLRKLLKSIT